MGPAEPCKRCKATRAIVEDLMATEFKDKAFNFEHKDMTDPQIIAKFGVLKGPIVVVNDTVVSEGDIPKKEFLKENFKKLLV
jgi:disulfide oxidoreductase YuzD